MDRSNAKITRWLVTWTVVNPVPVTGYMVGEQVTTCALAEGQTDDLKSIRKMISLRRNLDPKRIEILAMAQIESDETLSPLIKGTIRCMVCGEGFASIPASMGHEHFES